MACVLVSGQVHELKVGLYNSFPDLQNDDFTTLVEQGFNNVYHTVNAVVDKTEYSPYGDLDSYLDGDFDLIEIDTASLLSIVNKIVDINSVTEMRADTLQTAKDSVQVDNTYCGYPTLACGNFMVALSPGTSETWPRDNEHLSFFSIQQATQTFKSNFFPPYKRLLGRKMNDEGGLVLAFPLPGWLCGKI